MDEKEKSRGISRREFLKDAGLVVGGAAVGAAITYPLVPKEVVKEVIKEVEVTKYKCPYCGVTVDTFDALKSHVTAQHPAEAIPEEVPKYVCPYCSAEFDTFSALKSHAAAEHPPGVVEPAFEPEESIVTSPGPSCKDPCVVDVKNGRIVRIRPLHYDWNYTKEELAPAMWEIEAHGKVIKPTMKSLPAPYNLTYKNRVYSPNRILYPLKRVDWEPEEGKRNPQNRGKSKFKRISWDEATDLIASEIKRIHAEYGPYAILCQSDGHTERKAMGAPTGSMKRLLSLLGGYTDQIRNADSWEGWYWGAKHVWGMQAGKGMQHPNTNMLYETPKYAELILGWSSDLETTTWGWYGQACSRELYWYKEVGIPHVFICPDLNYAAAVHADKWIPVLPNTDAAFHLAIAYVWLTEGTYDKDYLATHAVGYEKWFDYVLGKVDGVPKTPAWASPMCGVNEWTIKALAREWGAKTTTIRRKTAGSMVRGPYSHEPGRMEPYLLAMQGLGKPGCNQYQGTDHPKPLVKPSTAGARRSGLLGPRPAQFIGKVLIPTAILSDEPISWYGTTSSGDPIEGQFVKYTYPIPKEEGGTEVHMAWNGTPCWMVCWQNGNKLAKAYRSPKIETYVAQCMWLEDDSLYADIVLPINTLLEEEDIGEDASSFIVTFYRKGKCIESIGESKSDYDAVGEVAKKLGVYDKYTEGRTDEEWLKIGYEKSKVADLISWEKLEEKQYVVVPVAPDWEEKLEAKHGLRGFYEDPVKNPLETPSGLIEFYSERLFEHFPDDEERPPMAKWVTGGPGWWHDESLWGERCKKYPLLLISNHGRWKLHAQMDDATWLREIPTCKVKGPDGYMYEPVWIHPTDAAKRGIESGDIVKMYNERGTVLGGALVMERIIPGAVYQDHGARLDEIIPGEIDRGGNNNAISPEGGVSANCWGMATSGFLVEVEKLDPAEMEEWRKKYPEAFARDYDPAYGPLFRGWVEGGM